MRRWVLAAIAVACWVAAPVAAQETQDKDKPKKEEQPSHTKVEGEKVTTEETVVVSASKVESTLINAPATLSVITGDTIEAGSAQNYGDLLRTVPGVNVIQMSARDINITSRQSTSTLSNSQLALLDGRSIYLDFFGLILWDFVPTDPDQIKQIEVVRGPASAVWGANALTGVVNIITKSPREAVGNNLSLTGGLFNRPNSTLQDDGNGYTYGGNVSIARAPNDRISWRLTAGYFNSDPYARPEGTAGGCPINTPCVPHPLAPAGHESDFLTGGAPLLVAGPGGTPVGTTYKNTSTSQPKVDLRVDQDLSNGARLVYEGGYAGSSGIIHTGIGPFDIDNGSYMAYGKVNFSKGALKINGFANFLDAKAPNLLFVDPATLQPVLLKFQTQTYDFEIGHSQTIASHHLLSYGGNARRNNFDISLAPDAQDRNEFGAYFQDEIFYDKFRLALGGRVDKFGNIDHAVWSPRITAMFKPTPDHSIRVSFNRAFRAPSVINNYLDQNIFLTSPLIDVRKLAPVAFAFGQPDLAKAIAFPFELVVRNTGNADLKEESLNAYELAYTGTINKRTTLGLAIYRNDSNDSINFTRIIPTAENPQGLLGFDVYTPANAPSVIGINTQGAPVPGTLVPFLAQLGQFGFPVTPLPRTVSNYLNLSGLRQDGLEASINHDFGDGFSLYANYSYQKTPKLLTPDAGQIAYPIGEVGIPAKNRFNAAVNMNTKRYIGSLGVNYSDKAFWTDVLSADYDAYTKSYSMVNAAFGVKWDEGRYTTSIKGNNIFNERVQQHSFGDVLQRSVYLELRAKF